MTDDELAHVLDILSELVDRVAALEYAVFDGELRQPEVVDVPGPDTWPRPPGVDL